MARTYPDQRKYHILPTFYVEAAVRPGYKLWEINLNVKILTNNLLLELIQNHLYGSHGVFAGRRSVFASGIVISFGLPTAQ